MFLLPVTQFKAQLLTNHHHFLTVWIFKHTNLSTQISTSIPPQPIQKNGHPAITSTPSLLNALFFTTLLASTIFFCYALIPKQFVMESLNSYNMLRIIRTSHIFGSEVTGM